jgi:dUTP pyrophosphatase
MSTEKVKKKVVKKKKSGLLKKLDKIADSLESLDPTIESTAPERAELIAKVESEEEKPKAKIVKGLDLGVPGGDKTVETTVKVEEGKMTVVDTKIIDPETHTLGKVVGGELTKKFPTDAGLDIRASTNFIIPAQGYVAVPTGLRIAIPEGHVGLITSRSGMAFDKGIETGAGTIDVGYSGEVKILLHNHSKTRYSGAVGDRIAQLLTIPVNLENYIVVEELPKSDRGDKGFGHSGNK